MVTGSHRTMSGAASAASSVPVAIPGAAYAAAFGLSNPKDLPMLHMIRAHWTSPEYMDTVKMLASDSLATALPYFSLFYIAMQPFVRRYFQYGKHYEDNKKWWKAIMWRYNWGMAAFSFTTLLMSGYAVLRWPIMTEDCDLLFREPVFWWAVYLFYVSKYVEYADTVFLLVMQKKGQTISWLQWFHHIGAPVNMWLLHRSQGEPVWVFVLFNSFIHTIMYIYYAYAVRGQQILPKQIITSMQILQFTSGFFILWEYRHIPCFGDSPLRMISTFYFTYYYVGSVLILFINFFVKNYIFGTPKKKGAPAPAAAAAAAVVAAAPATGNGTKAHGEDTANGHSTTTPPATATATGTGTDPKKDQ